MFSFWKYSYRDCNVETSFLALLEGRIHRESVLSLLPSLGSLCSSFKRLSPAAEFLVEHFVILRKDWFLFGELRYTKHTLISVI